MVAQESNGQPISARGDLAEEEAALTIRDSRPSPGQTGHCRRQGYDRTAHAFPRLVVDDRPPDFDNSCWTLRRRPGLLPYQHVRDRMEEEYDGPHG